MEKYGNRCCPKCGSGSHHGNGISTKWFPARPPSRLRRVVIRALRWLADDGGSPGKVLVLSDCGPEHLARKCNTCGYTWGELPLDTPSPLEQLAGAAE